MREAPLQEIVVDPEFSALIPPLSPDERAQLRENIKRDGCREPLVLWGSILLDGHNRYKICESLGIGYRTIQVKGVTTRSNAADWIDANQLGRRNLTPEAASLLRGRRYNRTKGIGRPEKAGQNVRVSAETLADQHGVDEKTIRRDGQFASAVESLKPAIPDIEQRVMAGDVPSKSAVVDAAKEPERAAEILSKPHVTNNSGNNEWYTPAEYIEAARRVMGGIDLDPASTEIANRTIGAKTIYTAEDDGLKKKWNGRVWMNPPYAQPLVSQFSDAVADKFDAGEIKQACVLVNNATETAWFQRMVASAAAVCFPKGRVRFLNPEGQPVGAPLQGQAVIYLGKNVEKFTKVFESFGPVLMAPELQEDAAA